jgi:hypothetical protein
MKSFLLLAAILFVVCAMLVGVATAQAESPAKSTVYVKSQSAEGMAGCVEPPPTVAPSRLVRKIGRMRVDTGLASTYARATAAFGKPARTWASGHNDTRVHALWRGKRAMHIVFQANYPPDVSPDSFEAAFFLKATLTGKAWRTWKSVRIGQTVAKLRSVHRTAWKVKRGQWSIADYCASPPADASEMRVSLLGVFKKGKLAELRVRSVEADLVN